MECPKNCQCGVKCQNQRMQKHADARTELRFMGGKGWGLLAKEDLKQGLQFHNNLLFNYFILLIVYQALS